MKTKRNAWKPDSPLARKMSDQLNILDRSERTVTSYLSSIRLLANFYQCSPGRMSEQQVRDYLLDCKSRLAHNSMRGICAGIKFFYTNTCPRDWKLLRSLRVAKSRTVPQVVNADEIESSLRYRVSRKHPQRSSRRQTSVCRNVVAAKASEYVQALPVGSNLAVVDRSRGHMAAGLQPRPDPGARFIQPRLDAGFA